ncbi:MAG: ABC transporter ATP-binding protein [Rhodospirillaceae bacterium]|nr:ABC transporter ATP-binding protein [Rhodospirillaceae bacterium]
MTLTLRAEAIATGYGKLEVVHDVSLTTEAGRCTCVFGPNGSGKSTLIKAIAGALPLWRGRVFLGERELTGRRSHDLVREGIVLMPQGGGVFPRLSVMDNLRMGGYAVPDRREVERRIDAVLSETPVLRERRRVPGGRLSGGEQMMLALGRILVAAPRFVLLDEPSAGLAPAAVSTMLERIGQLKERGVGVLMVEQNIREALRIADRVYVLVAGSERFHGAPADLGDEAELMKLYMGG